MQINNYKMLSKKEIVAEFNEQRCFAQQGCIKFEFKSLYIM
jgi:hypothetical protein